MMRREFEVFDSALKALPAKEHDIVYTFIHKDRNMPENAEDRDLAYQAVKKLIGDIKKCFNFNAFSACYMFLFVHRNSFRCCIFSYL